MALRQFFTWLPYWRPVPKRYQLYSGYRDIQWFAAELARLMYGDHWNANEANEAICGLGIAYTRSKGKYAFESTENDWQEVCARHYLSKVSERNYVSKCFSDLEVVSLVPKSRAMRFKHVQIKGTLNEENYLRFVSSCSTGGIHGLYERQWTAPKFACITEDTAPIPSSINAIKCTTDMGVGLMLQLVMIQSTPYYHLQRLRSPCLYTLALDSRHPEASSDCRTVCLKADPRWIHILRGEASDDVIAQMREYASLGMRQLANMPLPCATVSEIDKLLEGVPL